MLSQRIVTVVLCSFLVSASAKLESSVQIVLARCRENIDWIDEMGYGAITTVYDKCKVTTGPGSHVVRPNMGREGGTYLQHIVDNYDNLADWTVFTQAERPTYGYRGHRLGGGHMMRNVLFQDYVEAANTRDKNPLFFIFTSVMVSRDNQAHQSIRQGYGEEFTQPSVEPFGNKMCGKMNDWQRWYEFPQWFTDMLQRLQQEQNAPMANFDVAKAFEMFSIQPTQGVTFFAQGARFAASREAIQARPKEYYEGILKLFQHQDPWAGYYLEWMWYYVLGGSNSPCGFEEPVLHGHLSWKKAPKGREDFVELSGVSGIAGTEPQPPTTTPSEDSSGMIGLIGLVALVPLLGACAVGAWILAKKGSSEGAGAAAVYTQYYYPEALQQGAYSATNPQSSSRDQGGFYDPGMHGPVPSPTGFNNL